jgi:hypothetical protein
MDYKKVHESWHWEKTWHNLSEESVPTQFVFKELKS